MAEEKKKGLLKRAVEAGQGVQERQRADNLRRTEQAAAANEQRTAAMEAERHQQQEQLRQAIETGAHAGVEYRVEQLRETIVGDKIQTGALAALCNRLAGEGWTLKQVVPASVTGRVGPGGTGGLVAIFERPLRA